MIWETSVRQLSFEKPLVMAIVNVTPDSFSDGGKFVQLEAAIRQAEKCVNDGADILDIGGESTRPGSQPVSIDEEMRRVIPVVEAIARRFDIPISVDTTKSGVARHSVAAGAEIINDISGLRFDPLIAHVAAETGCGLVLMHSRGSFETMHAEPPADDIMVEVANGFRQSIKLVVEAGVATSRIALDPGIGFGKTFDQNLELLANLDKIRDKFLQFPMIVGASRKSFIGKILDGAPPDERLNGSLASAVIAAMNGADLVRVHDVRETVEALKVVSAIRGARAVC